MLQHGTECRHAILLDHGSGPTDQPADGYRMEASYGPPTYSGWSRLWTAGKDTHLLVSPVARLLVRLHLAGRRRGQRRRALRALRGPDQSQLGQLRQRLTEKGVAVLEDACRKGGNE
jgi:hypothetical protein